MPGHLFEKLLKISLWDFSWYTRAGAGEPYESLGKAFDEAAERGYNTVRICAAPLLLYGNLGLGDAAERLSIEGLGSAGQYGYYGQRTRWYDAPGGYQINLRERLFILMEEATTRGFSVILSSWEYQQSPAFSASDTWYRAIESIPHADRLHALAEAFDRMHADFARHGWSQTVAFTELHNEVDFSHVPDLTEETSSSLTSIRANHPDQLFTVSYGKPPYLDMARLHPELPVGQFHIYAYGVLDALQRKIDIREHATAEFPNAYLSKLLQAEAPTVSEYGQPAAWKYDATVVTDQMVYGYDWIDPEKWDRWLYAHYANYRSEMFGEIDTRLRAVAAWSRRSGAPFVIGEGWIGYTPRDGEFEEGPVGRELAEYGVKRAVELGAWGVTPCSNAAPHHSMWANVKWQKKLLGSLPEGPVQAPAIDSPTPLGESGRHAGSHPSPNETAVRNKTDPRTQAD